DIEGATRIGDTIYWTGSLGNNKDGEYKARLDSARRRRMVPGGAGWCAAALDGAGRRRMVRGGAGLGAAGPDWVGLRLTGGLTVAVRDRVA
ncbi:hypothetical protein AB0D43_35830, partial [Streptomyces sp. NPDC048357]